MVVEISKDYGLLLSRDWSLKLNGYFSISWSHFLLPNKEKLGYIRIDSEKHHKFVVTKLNIPNENMMFCQYPLRNYCFDTNFRNFEVETIDAIE